MANNMDGATVETQPNSGPGDLLSLEEAAQFLGTSTTTLYRLLRQNDLSGLKVGRQWRFRKSDLLIYLERSSGATDVALSEEAAGEIAFFCPDAAGAKRPSTSAGDAESEIRRLADGILRFAIDAGASDIHLEPVQHGSESHLAMRMRVDGLLQEVRRLPISLHPPLVKSWRRSAGIDGTKLYAPRRGHFHLPHPPSGKGSPEYIAEPVGVDRASTKLVDEEMDELLEQAAKFVVSSGQGSTSLVQRRFRIGYTRAVRLMEMMEARGVVGPIEDGKPREVRMARERVESLFREVTNAHYGDTEEVEEYAKDAGTPAARRFEIWVSCLPTTRGEDLAIRLCLPPTAVVNGLERVEMAEEQRTQVGEWLHHRHGLIVTTGLGQRKELLYNLMLEVAAPERKALLLEEFPDYALPYATSIPVNRPTGTTLADALRAAHNHDPDVIMVETTRDAETVRLIHELAFTEYLVLTSVPANGAGQAVRWLLEQEMEPLIVARTLRGIVAQWQARRICENCKEPVEQSLSEPVLRRVQQIAANGGYTIPRDATFYQGRGCERCHHGYKGRVDLFEVMTWTPELTDALLQGASAEELTQVAVAHGMRTLIADGIGKAVEAKTTLDEVLLAGMATI
jgi:excisionase family DNA binding protein